MWFNLLLLVLLTIKLYKTQELQPNRHKIRNNNEKVELNMVDKYITHITVTGTIIIWLLSYFAVARERAAVLKQSTNNEQIEARPAGLCVRAAAKLVDYLVLNVAALSGIIILALLEAVGAASFADWWLIALIIPVLVLIAYFTIFTAVSGQTWGKKLAGVVVERSSGGRLGWGRSFVRANIDVIFVGLYQLVIGLIDPLLLAVTRRKRSLHDLLVGSSVVRTKRTPSPFLPWMAALGWVIPIVLMFSVIKPMVIQTAIAPSESMEPTLTKGDRILVNRLAYRVGKPKRGDVVVISASSKTIPGFDYPDKPVPLVKRLIALPGDKIRIEAETGVFINGKLLDEPYVKDLPNYDYPEVRIPEGKCFVLGDNRRSSMDSRYWAAIPLSAIQGKVSSRFQVDSSGLPDELIQVR